jgi:hypothetical protein
MHRDIARDVVRVHEAPLRRLAVPVFHSRHSFYERDRPIIKARISCRLSEIDEYSSIIDSHSIRITNYFQDECESGVVLHPSWTVTAIAAAPSRTARTHIARPRLILRLAPPSSDSSTSRSQAGGQVLYPASFLSLELVGTIDLVVYALKHCSVDDRNVVNRNPVYRLSNTDLHAQNPFNHGIECIEKGDWAVSDY